MIRFLCLTLSLLTLSFPSLAQTGQRIPEMPEPIKNLELDGAQVRYMGNEYGFDAWLSVKNGQQQFFYVPPGGKGFVMGVLFDNNGRVATVDQLKRLRDSGDETLKALTDVEVATQLSEAQRATPELKTPSERLFYDTQNTNWIAMGDAGAPIVYAVVEPQCPHCHALIDRLDSEGYFKRGALQLRMIPVGFGQKSLAQAAFMLAAPNPAALFLKHIRGEEIPVRDGINTQGVERNLAYMQGWKFDVTPLLVYRSAAGSVQIVRGTPKDLDGMLAQLKPAR